MKIVIKLLSAFLLIALLIGGLSIFGINIINRDIIEIVERENPKVQASLELEINIHEMADAVSDYSREEKEETIIRFKDSQKDFKRFMDIYLSKIRSNEEEELIGELARKQDSMRILGEEIIETKKRVNVWLKKIVLNAREIENILENKLSSPPLNDPQHRAEKTEISLKMEIDIGHIFFSIEEYINDPKNDLISRIKKEETKFEAEEARYRRLPLSAEERKWLDIVDKDYKEIKKLAGELIQFERQQRRDMATFETILQEADNLLDDQIQVVAMDKIAEDERRALFNTTLVMAAIFLSVMLSVVVGYFISIPITDPIIKLRDAANQVGRGDLNVKIDINSKDEVGELAESFNIMLQEIKKLKEGLEQTIEELTETLNDKMAEMERFNNLAIGRELKMIELKKEIKQLKEKLERDEDI
ncbi:MAG: HAMP domain-containing protein [Nitrospinae bacterium]|nr:HAMP domain-containing protein [Nitrospinota bacterium]